LGSTEARFLACAVDHSEVGPAWGHGPYGLVFVAIGRQTFGGNAGERLIPGRRELILRLCSHNYNHGIGDNCDNYDRPDVIIMIIVIATIATAVIIMIIMMIA